MKKFDWVEYRSMTNNYKWQWFFDNHNKPITEDEFIDSMKQLRQYSNSKNKQKRYCTSSLRREYNYIKSKFGFFNLK